MDYDVVINLLQRTSFENDWKLISIFIGGNDLCDLGSDPIGASPDTYRNEIKAALDLMHQEVGTICRGMPLPALVRHVTNVCRPTTVVKFSASEVMMIKKLLGED